jgi:hypothetical protein
MTASEFSKHENNRVALATLLLDPLLRQAFTVLLDELAPGAVNDGVINPVVGAARYQQIAGANHIVKGLERLTKPPKAKGEVPLRQLLPEPPLPTV